MEKDIKYGKHRLIVLTGSVILEMARAANPWLRFCLINIIIMAWQNMS